MRRWLQAIALCCAVAALAGQPAAPPATAAAGNPIIADCQDHGRLTQTYTLRELQHALAVMPASVKQYSNCYDVIQNALIKARHGPARGSASGRSGGPFLPVPVIVILALLVAAALAFGALAWRHRPRPDR